MSPRILLLCFATCLLVSPLLHANSTVKATTAYLEGNRLFERGDYANAAEIYETLATNGHASAELFFNLGVAKYRLGESGEAVLWMRRALILAPGMPEARQSLAFLQPKFAYLEFVDTRVERLLSMIPPRVGPWIIAVALWCSLIALSAALFLPRMKQKRSTLVVLSIIFLLLAVLAGWTTRYRAERIAVENFATVTRSGGNALTAPAPDAKTVISLPLGTELRILQTSGDWSYVEIPGDLRGWVRRTTIENNWPLHSNLQRNELPQPLSQDTPLPESTPGPVDQG